MIETVPSGTVLKGRYRIERVLGSGGFGHVYLAIDLVTNQQYAVKEYLVTGTSGQEQLKHEANVLGQLHHPNLPAFHDGFNERGRYYVVLNYIEGSDLTDLVRIAKQRNDIIPLSRIMGWLLSICDAVHFLHNQHPPVIHRDIKPDNIRITPEGTAILVDLGNAKSAADGARTLFFIRHQGTPGYAPQEQYPGGSGTDVRSDVYALAGTLYFALTAHEPPSVSTRNQSIQQGQTDLPSLQEQLAKNPPEDNPEAQAARQFRLGVTKPGKPLPRHSKHVAQLGTLPPELLARLNLIIQKAMAMRQKDRYPTIAEFANDLKKVMDALPSAPPATASVPDPHGTQPDLPMLYEAIQAAKDNQTQGTPDAHATSPSVTSSSAIQYCPRCNTPLVVRAAFCPNCGTVLNNTPNASASTINTTPPSASTVANTPGPQTIRAVPKGQTQQAPGVYSPKIAPQQAYPAQNPSFKRGQQGVVQTQNKPSSSKGFSIGPGIIIFMAIVLVILLLIMILLIQSQGHHLHTSIPSNFYTSFLEIRAQTRS